MWLSEIQNEAFRLSLGIFITVAIFFIEIFSIISGIYLIIKVVKKCKEEKQSFIQKYYNFFFIGGSVLLILGLSVYLDYLVINGIFI